MTLKTAAIPEGVNNTHTVSFFLFFPNVNGITHIIKTFFFFFLIYDKIDIKHCVSLRCIFYNDYHDQFSQHPSAYIVAHLRLYSQTSGIPLPCQGKLG